MKKTIIENPTRIQVFENEMFGKIRTMTDEQGETFFVGKDVAQALGYSNASKAVQQHVDKEDRAQIMLEAHSQNGNLLGKTLTTIINESGLYSLILSSQLEQARVFKRWVTCEVLPQIRQTGGFIPTRDARTGEALSEGEIMQRANSIMQRTISRRNLPADDCLTTTDVARGMGLEVKDLNRLLVDKGIIRWTGGRYRMTPAYAERGYDESRLFCYHSKEGEAKQRTYLVWTPAGKTMIEGLMKCSPS